MPSLYHVTSSYARMGKIHFSTPLTLDLTMWPVSAVEMLAGIILNVLVWYNWVLTLWDCHEREACPRELLPLPPESQDKYTWRRSKPKNVVEPSTAESQPEKEPPSQPLPNYCWPADSLCMNKCVLLQTMYCRSICVRPYCSNWLVHYFSLVPWDEGPWG